MTDGKRSRAELPILLTNIRQLLTLRGGTGARRGPELSELSIIEDAAVLCAAGKITAVGSRHEALKDSWLKSRNKRVREIDCRGGVVLPGFVDSHTHPVFVSPRLTDFEKRITGASYEQIAAAGGGICSSIEGVRNATRSQLTKQVLAALEAMRAQGTTTVEAKSGYGLSVESELKSLQAIRDAARLWPGTVVPTLLGAHAVPGDFNQNPQEYVRLVCEQMIPQAAGRRLARFVDVFCERGTFSPEDTRRIFAAGRIAGLGVRAHICQLHPGAIQPLLEFEPVSLDHLDHVSNEDIAALARSETVATLVPGANYFLGLNHYPPARKLIDAGAAVALATDFNPGTSPTLSMPFVLSLACTHMQMSPAEAICAATINGAWALRMGTQKGSIEPGKDADLAIFDVEDYREIPYWVAANRCAMTIVGGETGTSS